MATKVKGFRIEILGGAAVAKRLSQPATKLLNKNIKQAGKILLKAFQKEVPVRSGKLKRSLVMKRLGKNGQAIWVDTRARFTLLGVRKHPIFPSKRNALFWPGIRGGRPVPMVNHPGQKKNQWFERSVRKVKPQIQQLNRQFGLKVVKNYDLKNKPSAAGLS